LLVAGTLLLGACSGVTPPEDQLAPDDVQFLAAAIDASTSGVFDDFFDASSSDPSAAPALTHQPVVWTGSFERSRPCHEGGTLTVTGSGTRTWDPEERTYDVEASGTKTRVDCAHTRDDVVITLNGNAAWTHERHYQNFAPTGVWVTTYIGGFDWSKSTGETGSCFYDLTRTVDTAENTRHLGGTFCGNDVDRTTAWR
jgi:hypothetical protein